MSRAPLHALIWSKEQRLYELYTQSQIEQRFQPTEEAAWLAWLHGVSSFAFHGARGSLNVYQEQRPRGERIGMPIRPVTCEYTTGVWLKEPTTVKSRRTQNTLFYDM